MFVVLAVAALTFYTGQPQLQDPPMPRADTWIEYQADVAPLRGDRTFIMIRKRPARLSANARYGVNLVLSGTNRGWIVDRKDGRWVLYADWPGTGDLVNAIPEAFQCSNDVCRIDRSTVVRDTRQYIRFEVSEKHGTIYAGVTQDTARRGVITIGARRAAFTLYGDEGMYDVYSEQTVQLDESSGKQRYSVRERHLNLFGKSYGFTVAHDGSSLTLTPLPVTLSNRPTLLPGSAAPDFVVKDIDGNVQSLSAYRGRTVLLDFWATWCHPCHRDAAHLRAAAAKYPNLAIVGIAPDSAPLIRTFTKQNGITWPQVRDDVPTGPLHTAYRVEGFPTYFLIGPDGRILTTWTGADINDGRYELDEQLAEHLPAR